MAYDKFMADRIRRYFDEKKVDYFEKNMFSGLVFMLDEKMVCGIHFDKKKDTDLLMARIGPEAAEEHQGKEGCQAMDFTGRPMHGYVFITPDGYDSADDLEFWLQLCLDFNPLAKTSKKRKPKEQ